MSEPKFQPLRRGDFLLVQQEHVTTYQDTRGRKISVSFRFYRVRGVNEHGMRTSHTDADGTIYKDLPTGAKTWGLPASRLTAPVGFWHSVGHRTFSTFAEAQSFASRFRKR